ncbi:YceI family protein [Aromatoleum bremense]|uniref:Polyisoprenoid-binding protein n=1 Tax=Aromatoleum bremense TaxID=76115 RepID=A0ABX1NYZ7_9RHOO|nr:YceI family protein [Aromatoleum bremense]NMG17202.1 polyisoprenoid-binding protein [Aromatoleum bremense]QTQ30550.1 Lipid/polyisoprenoid-binding protein, YceI-like [Aromatoleum bremense]
MNASMSFNAALLAVALPLATGAALAAGPDPVFSQVQADKSRVDFVFKQMNVPIEGHFGKVRTDLVFDAAAPAKSSVRLELDLASIDAGSSEANSEVLGKPWFNVKDNPTATFVSTAVRPLGGNRYEVVGNLSLKGRTQLLTAPVTVTRQGDTATFDGGFTLKRLEFAIGDGMWADTSVVANDVDVRFHAVARSAGVK